MVHSDDFWRVQLEAIYRRRNPHKLGGIEDLLTKYKGKDNGIDKSGQTAATFDSTPLGWVFGFCFARSRPARDLIEGIEKQEGLSHESKFARQEHFCQLSAAMGHSFAGETSLPCLFGSRSLRFSYRSMT